MIVSMDGVIFDVMKFHCNELSSQMNRPNRENKMSQSNETKQSSQFVEFNK